MSTWRKQEAPTERGRRGRGTWSSRARGSGSPRNQRLENIASVSRSSGLEKDGDALKDFKTQEDYRAFIQEKLEAFWRRPLDSNTLPHINEVQENLLILFRKLREGIVSSKRNDEFSMEVYEASLHLATLFDKPRQINSIVPYLIPHLSAQASPWPQYRTVLALLVALIQQLLLGYPSQSSFHQTLGSIPDILLQRSSDAYHWISGLAAALRAHNFSKFERLTRPASFRPFLDPTSLADDFQEVSISGPNHLSHRELAHKAFCHVVDALRAKVRQTSWEIIRCAYREISCQPDSVTREWLIRSLALRTVHSGVANVAEITLDEWLEEKKSAGHVRQKEGVEGRWLICKVQR